MSGSSNWTSVKSNQPTSRNPIKPFFKRHCSSNDPIQVWQTNTIIQGGKNHLPSSGHYTVVFLSKKVMEDSSPKTSQQKGYCGVNCI